MVTLFFWFNLDMSQVFIWNGVKTGRPSRPFFIVFLFFVWGLYNLYYLITAAACVQRVCECQDDGLLNPVAFAILRIPAWIIGNRVNML